MGVLFNITGGSDLRLSEVHEAAEVIQRVVSPDCNIIFGMVTDQKSENEIKLTVIATGFPTTDTVQEQDEDLRAILRETTDGKSNLDLPPFLRRLSKYSGNGRVQTPVS